MRATVLVRPKEGILDPQGDAVGQSLRKLGFDVATRPRRTSDRPRASRPTTRTGAAREIERMCQELLANPLIESFEIRVERVVSDRPLVAVVVFPGSNDDRDAAWALGSVGAEPTLVWHEETSLPAETGAVVLPGGFSYGDYLRTGAIASVAPVMDAGAGVRRGGRSGARHLQRLPDPLRGASAARGPPPEQAARVRLPRRSAAGRDRGQRVHAPLHRRPGARHPRQARRGRLVRRRGHVRRSSRRAGRSSSATRRT